MKISQYLTTMAVISGMMSCVTSTYYFDELPPELTLPPACTSVTLVSAFDTTLLDFREAKNAVFTDGSREVIQSLTDELNRRSDLEVIKSEKTIRDGELHFHAPDSINSTMRSELAKTAETSLLLVLESYSLEFDQNMEVVRDDDGSKTRTAHYDFIATALLSLYDSTGQLFDESLIEQVHPDYNSRIVISGLLSAGPAMGKAGKEANQLSRNIGTVWVDKFFPSEVMVVRSIFKHKALKAGTKALRDKNWESAISLLIPLTSHSDAKIAGLASHNLSVAYEAIGDWDLSDQWRIEASELLSDRKLLQVMNY